MGSKVELLRGPLGRILLKETEPASRFVDLFSGSGSVAKFVAERRQIPVVSSDLQTFACVLAASVIERAEPYSNSAVLSDWCKEVSENLEADRTYLDWRKNFTGADAANVTAARRAAHEIGRSSIFTSHYGGHYFSPSQSLELDALYANLPPGGIDRTVALAALIQSASRCAASPGHTAQPFQPTENLLPHIRTAWSKSFVDNTQGFVESIAKRHALVAGSTERASAAETTKRIAPGDVVFCDPPYSDVQYSRFYHVLEGISIGGWPDVTGTGRAPDLPLRERSSFSLRTQSQSAMGELLGRLHEQGCRSVIITFPNTAASNGLSASKIAALSRAAGWQVRKRLIDSTHSTLGGQNDGGARGSRKDLREAVFVLSNA